MPKALSSSSLYLCSCLQSLQMRRTSRCATMRFTALATLNGSIPMSTIRVTVDGASLVCSVERTRWPVSADLMAIDPVSRSGLEPELGEVELQVALVENPQHDLLAEQHREGRHAEVDHLGPHLELDAPVLRHAPLGDVQLRHDLHARSERRSHLDRRLHHLVQS